MSLLTINRLSQKKTKLKDNILRTPAEPISEIDSTLLAFIQEMIALGMSIPTCVGLASNQVWKDEVIAPPAIFIARLSAPPDEFIVFINPLITKFWGSRVKYFEGCLSKKDQSRVWRHERINITYYDQDMTLQHKEFVGHGAQILQHEWDHLQGKLI